MNGTVEEPGESIRSITCGAHMPNPLRVDLQFSHMANSRNEELQTLLERYGTAGLLLLNVKDFFAFQKVYGEDFSGLILNLVEQHTERVAREILVPTDFLMLEKLDDGDFVVVFDNRLMDGRMLQDLAVSVQFAVQNIIAKEMVQLTGQRLSLRVGYACIQPHETIRLEQSFYTALCDAREIAKGRLSLSLLGLLDEFRSLLRARRLSVVYQPIVDFKERCILGWESLTRGPVGSHFRSPQVLFDFAEEVGSLFALEKICRELAFRDVGKLLPGQKLFLNIHPRTLTDPQFTPGETAKLLKCYGFSPENIVFEITERHSIAEFTLFYRTLDHYRKQGYLVAVDDVGTGFSGLSSIAEIRPDFLKVDMSLIRGIDSNPVKRALLETLVNFSDRIGSAVIAEGIERETELSSVVSMGVHYGQGFYLAEPAFPKPAPVVALPADVVFRKRQQGEWKCSIPVQELMEEAPQIDPSTEVKVIRDLLETGQPISGIVAVENRQPIGLVMSHHLNRQLGTHYGVALYFHRSIKHVMDTSPLIVDGNTPVEMVANMAMNRESFKIYDHIIVVRNGMYSGVVSVQRMLDALARVQLEMAKGANPLTGLPGNVAIEREILRRREAGKPISLIYVDLDYFKVYNDLYGFEDGDKVLLLLAKILTWALKRHGATEDFAGHIGGDDFVLITRPERAARLAVAVVRCFKRLIVRCYKAEDRELGYVVGKDRKGNEGRFPLVSVSLAIVDCRDKCEFDNIGRRAAEMKRYAKTIPGNKFVRDRRNRNENTSEQPPPKSEQGEELQQIGAVKDKGMEGVV